MTEEAIRGRVQLLTQAAALLVVLAYVAGFLTLSLHHASYGISQFSLLRPRILSAGTIFLILMTLGAVSAVQIFGLWKLNYPTRAVSADAMGPAARGEGPQPPKFFRSSIFMLRILTLLQFATFLSVMISIYVFTGDYDLVDRSGVWGTAPGFYRTSRYSHRFTSGQKTTNAKSHCYGAHASHGRFLHLANTRENPRRVIALVCLLRLHCALAK